MQAAERRTTPRMIGRFPRPCGRPRFRVGPLPLVFELRSQLVNLLA